MATSEKVKFCPACWNKCRLTNRFCTCGENISAKTSIDDNGKKDIRTFDDYMLLNSKKKRFPVSSTITTRSKFFKKVNDKTVMINVGIIRTAEDNKLNLVKGSKLPVQVRKGFDANQVLKSVLKKTRGLRAIFLWYWKLWPCVLKYEHSRLCARDTT